MHIHLTRAVIIGFTAVLLIGFLSPAAFALNRSQSPAGSSFPADGPLFNPNPDFLENCSRWSPDTDDDGLPDCADLCPFDPEKIDPGDCGCGEPDEDFDGDGIPDCVDACNDSVDSDEDGVPDCYDQCPGEPDADDDGDGILNCFDLCPSDPRNLCD